MTALSWDLIDERPYEYGADRGVLYLPDRSGIPWSGLTSVSQNENKTSNPIHFDGRKAHDIVELGDFSASVKALTYPDILDQAIGLSGQMPSRFDFSYRTMKNETDYKLHVVYNCLFQLGDRDYQSISDSPSPVEFEWKVTAPRIEVPGFAPTAQITIDSTEIDPALLPLLEQFLYGNESVDAYLPPLLEFIPMIQDWARLYIFDNEDGTWTATTVFPEYITDLGSNLFRLNQANVVYSDPTTFEISNTSLEE